MTSSADPMAKLLVDLAQEAGSNDFLLARSRSAHRYALEISSALLEKLSLMPRPSSTLLDCDQSLLWLPTSE